MCTHAKGYQVILRFLEVLQDQMPWEKRKQAICTMMPPATCRARGWGLGCRAHFHLWKGGYVIITCTPIGLFLHPRGPES